MGEAGSGLNVGEALAIARVDSGEFDQPGSDGWKDVVQNEVELSLAPPVHQSVTLRHDFEARPIHLILQAISHDERLFVRLSWFDDTENTAESRTEFSDGAAIQFSLENDIPSSFMMGSSANPVNIWYWGAAGQTENIAAGGFGSTTKLDINHLKSSALYYEDGFWSVVFSRPLQVEGKYQVDLSQLKANFALAVWKGDAKQRDGLKYVTMGWLGMEPAS